MRFRIVLPGSVRRTWARMKYFCLHGVCGIYNGNGFLFGEMPNTTKGSESQFEKYLMFCHLAVYTRLFGILMARWEFAGMGCVGWGAEKVPLRKDQRVLKGLWTPWVNI